MIVAIAGSIRRTATIGDQRAVSELVGRLFFEHGRRLCVVSVACQRGGIGKYAMNACAEVNAKFCELYIVKYGLGFDDDKALLEKLYARRNLWLSDVADEFHLFLGPSAHDMLEEVAGLAMKKVGTSRVNVYRPGVFG